MNIYKKLDKISTLIPTPTPESFNSNSNSNSGSFNSNCSKSLECQLQLQLQLQLREFQLQLRQVSWISTPTPTPTLEVSTPIPTPTPELELELNPTPTPTQELTPTLITTSLVVSLGHQHPQYCNNEILIVYGHANLAHNMLKCTEFRQGRDWVAGGLGERDGSNGLGWVRRWRWLNGWG